jgi:hypothetical protein
MVEKGGTIIALCRFSLGIRILRFLLSLIFKRFYYVNGHLEHVYQILAESGRFRILSAVTIVEVILGIYKTGFLHF